MASMKKFYVKIVFILFSVMSIMPLYPQEEGGLSNLKKVADDVKFSHAVEFYKLERYDRALNEFNEYIEIYYDGIHRSEAFRKIAEIYIKRFDYQRAIEAYNRLYQEFSGTDEGLDAYFQSGVCYKKMGFDARAEAIFRYIVQTHPGTSAAYNSEIQLDLLKMENE